LPNGDRHAIIPVEQEDIPMDGVFVPL